MSRRSSRSPRTLGRRGDPPGLRLPGRERTLRGGCREGRSSPGSVRRPRRSRRWAPRPRRAQIMQKAGVPIVPGDTEPVKDVAAAKKKAKEIGYPIAVKAAGGGGGKGFRVAMEESELEDAFEGAAREGEKFFSDPTVYLERYLEDPRHVEVQVLADSKGNVIHLGERDCSIQRRHQKLIEESPGPEGRRGDARADRQDRHRRRRRGRLPLGGHGRGPAGRRRLLLPRDEHPRPGRALRHRDGHRLRHRARAGQDRGGRGALDHPGGRRAARPRDRVPDQRRGRPQELRAGARAGSRPTASPRAPASGSIPASRPAPR